MSTTSEFFKVQPSDDKTVTLLKQRIATLEGKLRRQMLSQSQEDCIICTFNFHHLQDTFDAICNLKESVLKLSCHNGHFISI